MEFVYQQPWKISDKRVARIDSLRAGLNETLAMACYQRAGDPFPYINNTTNHSAKAMASNILSKIKKINRKDNLPLFDQLVLQDSANNSQIAHSYFNYLEGKNTKNRKATLGSLMSSVFGKNAYSNLMIAVSPKNYPHQAVHRNSKLFHSLNTRQLDSELMFESNTPEFKNLKKQLLNRLHAYRKSVDNFYLDKGVLSEIKPSDYCFEFSPSGWGFSFWQDSLLLAAIDPSRVICYKPRGEKDYKIFEPLVSLLAVHEIGHGLNYLLSSRTMPAGLATSPETSAPIIHSTVSEGTAMVMEDFLIPSLTREPSLWDMSKKDVSMCKSFGETYIPKKLFQVVHDVLELEEICQDHHKNFPEAFKFRANTEFAKRTGIQEAVRNYYLFDDYSLDETLYQLSYFFGQKRARHLAKKMKQQGADDGLIMSGLLTGFWCSPQSQERFLLELFLPKYMKK